MRQLPARSWNGGMKTRTCRRDDSDTPAHDPGLWRMEADHAGKGEVRRKEGKKASRGFLTW